MRGALPITTVLTAGPAPLRSQARRASVVPLASARAILAFDQAGPVPEGPPPRMQVTCAGQPLARALFSTRLATQSGHHRVLMFLPESADTLCRSGIRVTVGDETLAAVDPSALQSPLADATALMAGLTRTAARRLLRALLTTCPSLFGAGSFAGFERIVVQLLGAVAAPVLSCRFAAALGARGVLLDYALPAGVNVDAATPLIAFGRDETLHLKPEWAVSETGEGGGRFLLWLREHPATDTALVALHPNPLVLLPPRGARRLSPPHRLHAALRPQTRALLEDAISRCTTFEPVLQATLDEFRTTRARVPVAEPLAAMATASGLLVVVRLQDPSRLVTRLRFDFGETVLTASPARHTSPDNATEGVFMAHLPCDTARAAIGTQLRVALVMGSGRARPVGRLRVAAFETVPSSAFAALPSSPDAVVAVAAALCGQAIKGAVPPVSSDVLGRPDAAPRLGIVVDVGESPEYPRALCACLAAERIGPEVELMFLLPPGRTGRSFRAALCRLHRMSGRAMTLVECATEASPASRLRTGLSQCHGAAILALSQDALPAAPGGIDRMLRRLQATQAPAIVAASVETAGGACLAGPSASGQIAVPPPLSAFRGGLLVAPTVPAGAIGLTRAAIDRLLDRPCAATRADADIALLSRALAPAATRLATADRFVVHAPLPRLPALLAHAESHLLSAPVPTRAAETRPIAAA